MSIIKKLLAEGVVSIYHNYITGTAYDYSGNNNHGVLYNSVFNNKGFNSKAYASGCVTVTHDSSLNLGNLNTLIVFYPEGVYNNMSATSGKQYQDMFYKKTTIGGYQAFLWYTGRITVSTKTSGGVTTDLSVDTPIHGKKYFGLQYNKFQVFKLWVDGAYAGFSGAITGDYGSSTNNLRIGNRHEITSVGECIASPIGIFMLIKRNLTNEEHAELYTELMSFKKPRVSNKIPLTKSANDKNSGAVFASDLEVFDNRIVNEVNGASGVISNFLLNAKTFSVDKTIHPWGGNLFTEGGRRSYATFSNFNYDTRTPYSISYWVKRDGSGSYNPTGCVAITSHLLHWIWDDGDFGIAYWDTTPVDIQRRYNINKLLPGVWHKIDFVYNTEDFKVYVNGELAHTDNYPTTAPPRYLGSNSLIVGEDGYARNLNGYLAKVEMVNYERTATEIANNYSRDVEGTGYTFNYAGINDSAATESGMGRALSNTPFTIGNPATYPSSRLKIITTTYAGKLVKAIEHQNTGSCFLKSHNYAESPTEASFGEWVFYWKPATAAGGGNINFIGNDQFGNMVNRYRIVVNLAASTMRLQVNSVTTLLTYSGWVPGEIYKHRIVRTRDGYFKWWVNDVLVGTSAADLTYTTTQGIVVVGTVGDQLLLVNEDNEPLFSKKNFVTL